MIPVIAQALTKFLKTLICSPTVPISFETYPEDIYTKTLIREHHDSHIYYIDTHSVVETIDEPSFHIHFTSPLSPNDTFQKKHLPV